MKAYRIISLELILLYVIFIVLFSYVSEVSYKVITGGFNFNIMFSTGFTGYFKYWNLPSFILASIFTMSFTNIKTERLGFDFKLLTIFQITVIFIIIQNIWFETEIVLENEIFNYVFDFTNPVKYYIFDNEFLDKYYQMFFYIVTGSIGSVSTIFFKSGVMKNKILKFLITLFVSLILIIVMKYFNNMILYIKKSYPMPDWALIIIFAGIIYYPFLILHFFIKK